MKKVTSQTKSKSKKGKIFQLSFVLILFVGIGLGAILTFAATNPDSQKDDSNNTSTTQKEFYSTGETSDKENISFTLNQVTVDSVGNTIFKPNTGNKFAIIDVSIINNDTEQFPVVPVTQVYLKDNDGNTYNITPAPLSSPLNAGNLPAGENLRGQLSFEVPSSLTGAKLYFDSGWRNATPSIFSISF